MLREQASPVARVLAVAVILCLPASAAGAQRATLQVALTPERLGQGTTIEFGFDISVPPAQVPLPLTGIDLSYPAHLGIATSGLGLATCSPAVLEDVGPDGCPANSRMGYGTALAEIPVEGEALHEVASTSIFMAPVQNETIALLFYADAEMPVSTQIVFPGLLLAAQAPFGGDLAISVPLVEGLPESPDVAVVRLRSTIGPRRLTYLRRRRGKLVPYRPKGIVLPDTCPRGGFPFLATFTFADATKASDREVVPCPARHRSLSRDVKERRPRS